METIKNYLESMFSRLPNTLEVQKAKYELAQMMEDKYTELKKEGNEKGNLNISRDYCPIRIGWHSRKTGKVLR